MIKVEDSGSIGKIVRQQRRKQGLDQATFSMICGFSEKPLKNLENGKGSLSVDKLLTIFSELGIQVHLEIPDDN